jgi:AraC-like DNA-binding protein
MLLGEIADRRCCSRKREMPWSTVQRFADPEAAGAAVQGSEVKVFPTAKGRFDTEITKVRFDRVWTQRFHSTLPQVVTVAPKPDRKAISFLTEPKSSTLIYCGIEVLPGDIIVNRSDAIHTRCSGEIRNGAMSLPTKELNEALRAITGRELPQKQKNIVRPDPSLMLRLLDLHRTVGQLAHTSPETLQLPAVGQALEDQLIHIMVRCLSEGVVLPAMPGGPRHDAIMLKFEELLEANFDRPIYLTEVCAGIGVTERAFRNLCEQRLGMGPIRYLKLRRMHLVRNALRAADAGKTNVTRIVTDHGFWELGRFSVAYRTLFGERPSETLRRPAEPQKTYRDRPFSFPPEIRAGHLN